MAIALNSKKSADVRWNYPLRTVVMWIVLSIHITMLWGHETIASWLWGVIFVHTLVCPHLLYFFSYSREDETKALVFDVTMYSVYMGLWGFPPFLAITFIATSNLTLMVIGGWRATYLSINFQILGLVLGGWLADFYFRPEVPLVPMLIAAFGFLVFMLSMGALVHQVNKRLHETRSRLHERHNELTHVNELAQAVNRQLDIDSIIRKLLVSLEHYYPLEAVYFLSYEEATKRLTMAGIYGEAISYREREAFEQLEFDFERDADSIFIMGLKQRRPINIGHLHPELVQSGAEIDKKLYDIKPSLSIIYFPVYIEDSVVGGLALINHKHNCILHKADIKRISGYLIQVGTAIKNANMLRQMSIAKEEALAAKEKAEASEEAKSRFLANMSHEIRTPMTAILGYSEALQETDITLSERRKFVDVIMSSGNHLLSMINNILDISKIEASKVHIEHIGIDVIHLLSDIEDYLALKTKEKGLDYSLTVNYPVPGRITNDPTRFKQVLLNLCNNAVKFTDRGSVALVLSWPQPNLIKVSVTDTGIGLTESECKSIFDAFSQADTSTTRLYGGTGLGLTISKSLAMLMGGNLEVVSTKGKGSCFSLTIDVGENASALIENSDAWFQLKKTKAKTSADSRVPALVGSVLVAEDNPVNQQIIRRLLELTGLLVEVVENGLLALESVKSNHYDLIFLDMQMPVMGGQKAAQLIRQEGIATPLVAFTANVMTHQVHSYFESGFIDVIEKPIDRSKLYALLADLVNTSASKLSSVMVVDDDEVNSMILIRQIKKYNENLAIVQASNGEEALLKADCTHVDLIFMDMEMPVMGGLEATQRLRENGFVSPIYMVTGNIDQEHKALCLAAGATGHLPKPLDKKKMHSVLELY